MKPQSGHYREILKDTYPFIRIALTHAPMSGVTRVNDANVIKVLEQSTDQFAQYYIDGLRNGQMVTIIENTNYLDQYFGVGELYFKS
jgi:hypothetical protein